MDQTQEQPVAEQTPPKGKKGKGAKKTPPTPNKVMFGGKELTVLDQKHKLVPKAAINIKLPKEDEEALALAITHDLPTLLIGETGTGKTSAVRQLAYLRKQGYVRINMHGYNTPDELIGSKSVKDGSTYYENGILTNAMINGHIVVLDEINATPPDCTFIIHGLLDEDKQISLPNGDVIKPHKDFRFFATMNPDYEGTKSLNRALLDRFNIILNIEVLKPELEEQLLVDRTNISEEMANKMVATAWLARKAFQDSRTLTLISTRSLLQWAKLVGEKMECKSAYVTSIVNKTRSDERSAFMEFYFAIFKLDPTADEKLDIPFVTTERVIKNYEIRIDTLQHSLKTEKSMRDRYEKDLLTVTKQKDALEKQINKAQADLKQIESIKKTFEEFQNMMNTAKPSNTAGGVPDDGSKPEMPF